MNLDEDLSIFRVEDLEAFIERRRIPANAEYLRQHNANEAHVRTLLERGLITEQTRLNIPTLEVEIPEGATILGISQDGTVSYILPHDNSN